MCRYSFANTSLLAIIPGQIMVVNCGNRTFDLKGETGGTMYVFPGASLTLRNCINENLGFGFDAFVRLVAPEEMTKPPVVKLEGGYYRMTTPEWCQVSRMGT
jgi:hypothetical protein